MAATTTPATLAKGALRRLAQAQQEPTPENYARAYGEEAGTPAASPAAAPPAAAAATEEARADAKAQGLAWAQLVERLSRNLERGGRQWTAARRKESLQRVLDGSRSDSQRLLQRLQSLMAAWEGDAPADPAATGAEDPPAEAQASGPTPGGDWPALAATLGSTLRTALPPDDDGAAGLAARLAQAADGLAADGATPERVAEIAALCEQAARVFGHRHRLVEQLASLCRELTAGLSELSEDESWMRGPCHALQTALADGPNVRGVRAASALLADTRAQQQRLRGERQAARGALARLIREMLVEVGELGAHTGRFQLAAERHAEAIESADSLAGLTDVVKALLADARAVHGAVAQSQARLNAERTQADALEARVRELEGELRRLSDEVSTDALTQVANRRGLALAFEAESTRCLREGGAGLAVGLIDIDNFKKLNDHLGHAAGDMALKTLAAAVRERLRPADHLARFGGEEFVVLLPATDAAEARQTLTRLQRGLTEALFLHEGREVFVTFSGGVTAWREGESLQAALGRADEALYEAKRSGKNRTCIG